jgi:hypothetical protein
MVDVPIDSLCIALELPSNEVVRAAVEAGMGSAAISASVVASSIEAGLISPLKLKLLERSFQALCHVERHRSHAAGAFLERITPRPRPATDKQKDRTNENHAGLTHSLGQLEENAAGSFIGYERFDHNSLIKIRRRHTHLPDVTSNGASRSLRQNQEMCYDNQIQACSDRHFCRARRRRARRRHASICAKCLDDRLGVKQSSIRLCFPPSGRPL